MTDKKLISLTAENYEESANYVIRSSKMAVEAILEHTAAERAAIAGTLSSDIARDYRGSYSAVLAYGRMPDTDIKGWYFAGWVDDIIKRYN